MEMSEFVKELQDIEDTISDLNRTHKQVTYVLSKEGYEQVYREEAISTKELAMLQIAATVMEKLLSKELKYQSEKLKHLGQVLNVAKEENKTIN